MARRDALLVLAKTLLLRRADLRKFLANELANLRDFGAADFTGDSGDMAFEAGSDEMASRLAELDARELRQIERAVAALKRGTYGICEGGSENCQENIPLARLKALPYTTFCINCERGREKSNSWQDGRGAGTWTQVFDPQAPMQDQRVNLSELEMNLTGNRRG